MKTEKFKMTINEFNALDFKDYNGYYWNSNEERPFRDFSNLELTENKIPFIIEGYLYSENEHKSIAIKNFNGEYVITQFDFKEIESNPRFKLTKEKLYPAYKIEGVKNIKFKELLQKKDDTEDFYYWKKATSIFVGFEKN